MPKREMNYFLNGSEYKLVEKYEKGERSDKPIWWKSIPLESGIGSTFHHGNPPTWKDHHDVYENGEKVGSKDTKIDNVGVEGLSHIYPAKFSKDPEAEIFIAPYPWSDGINPTPRIKTVDMGSELIIECDKVIDILWASTKGKIIKLS